MISINIYIYKNRIKYTNEKPYDITIIEIKPNDNVSEDSFLELDDNIFDKNKMMSYLQTSVYLLHYPNGNNVEYSTGKIKNISLDKYEIEHYCETLEGSSGSPIFKLTNFKVIGVHKGSKPSNCNAGTFLKGPIEDFYLKNKERNEILDEKPIIKVNERNIGQYNEIPKITTNQIKLILHQMKNCICRIFKEESGYGTGFLCYFPFPEIDSKFPTLITNNHVLDEKEMSSGQIISFSLGDDEVAMRVENHVFQSPWVFFIGDADKNGCQNFVSDVEVGVHECHPEAEGTVSLVPVVAGDHEDVGLRRVG